MIYKDKEKQDVTVLIDNINGVLEIDFYSDCGKFGIDEALDSFMVTPKRLLEILQSIDDSNEETN